mmetsp:Transcript_6700/g.10358  ORF Transcript_6700/g.10358 Transcript_6700/m.10358 type:complete len:92 (+) Transcript_6700:1237-1512(+)
MVGTGERLSAQIGGVYGSRRAMEALTSALVASNRDTSRALEGLGEPINAPNPVIRELRRAIASSPESVVVGLWARIRGANAWSSCDQPLTS